MPTETEKQQIRKLAQQGKSINHIRDKLQLPKSTVYYHFRKQVGQKQKRNALSAPRDPETIGELTGIFAGDGNFYKDKNRHYTIRFTLNHSEEYWKVLNRHLENKLSKKPHISIREEDNSVALMYSSKDLYQLFRKYLYWGDNKTKSICLHEEMSYTEEFCIGFLRGLIDTDGYRRPDHKRYVFTSASSNLTRNFSTILSDLEITHTEFKETDNRENYLTKHKIRITGSDVNKFSNIIEPRNPKKQYSKAMLE